MARKRRYWFPGAIYHITARGNRKEDIFLDSKDRNMYLKYLKETKHDCHFHIHAYCLMSNHVHLLMETPSIPPGQILQRLHLKYSKYFNSRYRHVGHLFQDRYHSEIILGHHYFKRACFYIHQNPEKAGIDWAAKDPLWSSNWYYLNLDEEGFVSTQLLMTLLSTSYEKALEVEKLTALLE
ncbi:transposase [Halobacillus sp. BBL2006]|uniref:transposase n=1 Tax=Halobacillus sp. BBL2006 TaxID=1543706 RepID=UPI000541D223|nr:transposase [Halobacillus sp. BBL2006]KHE66781.1 hypothetical protein LD39_20950 [Halobacillus sp. BBL2006]